MSHHCHAVGCEVSVPPAMFMCKRHWFAVPKALRVAVWAAYRRGQEIDKRPSATYLGVTDEARRVVAAKEGKLALWEVEHASYQRTADALRLEELFT